jgi:cephalosporin hydroxylase
MSTPIMQRGKAILKRVPSRYPTIAEIGVLTGGLSNFLLSCNWTLHLMMVDSWAPAEQHPASYHSTNDDHSKHTLSQVKTIESMARANVASFRDRVTVIKEWSHVAAERFDDSTIDLVFLDADHSYEGVLRDIRAWKSKIKPGGYIGGHDFENPDPRFKFEVERAVREVFPVYEIDENFTWFAKV